MGGYSVPISDSAHVVRHRDNASPLCPLAGQYMLRMPVPMMGTTFSDDRKQYGITVKMWEEDVIEWKAEWSDVGFAFGCGRPGP